MPAFSSNLKLDRPFRIFFLILTVFFGVYYGLFLQGMPYEQEAAMGGWLKATHTSWGQLVKFLLHPVSERVMVYNDIVIEVRVTEHFFLKAIYNFFGDSLNVIAAYNLITVLLFAALVYGMACLWTGSAVSGFATTFFLLCTPAYAWTIMEYGDFAPLDQMFLLLYLLFFIYYFQSLAVKKINAGRQIISLLLLWLVGMITLRTKEPNMFLVPGLSWFIFFINPGFNFFKADRSKKLALLPLGGILLLLSIPIVLTKRSADPNLFQWAYLQDPVRLFYHNAFGYAPEPKSSLFSLKYFYPSSILTNFGFFLSWILIATVIFMLWKKCHPGMPLGRDLRDSRLKSCGNDIKLFISPIPLLIFWTLLSLSFHVTFHSGLNFTRYQTWALLPFTLLVAVIFSNFIRTLPGKAQKIGVLSLVVLTLVTSGINISHSLYMRKGLERIWVPKWRFREVIMKDRTGAESPRPFEVLSYWYPRTDFPRAIEPYLTQDLKHENLAQDETFKTVLKDYGVAYIASNEPLELPWKSTLIDQIEADKMSLLTALKARSTKKAPKKYFLYRVTAS